MTSPRRIALPSEAVADVALRFGDEAIGYAELDRRANVAANALVAMGMTAGSAFAVLGENRPEILIAYLAAARIGAVFVSINAELKPNEVRYILDHAGCAVLLHDETLAALAAEGAPAELRRPIALLAGHAAQRPVFEPTVDDDFMIAYTSGTTGVPKAVVFDQAAETGGNKALRALWSVDHRDRIVVALPLGFLYGLSTVSAMALSAGAEVILLNRFHPKRLLEALVENRATMFHGVPTMFSMMLTYCEQNDLTFDLSFMRLLVCAGAPLAPALKVRFAARFSKAIDDYYALTEVRPVFGRFASDDRAVPAGAIGRAAPDTIIRIVDGAGEDVADGAAGEILVRAAGTMRRYHKDTELTTQSFRGDLFATGDIGFRDADGFYHLTGRIKDIIIRGGANIAPPEVEGVLLRHEAIAAAAVVGRPDTKFGEVPVAFVVRAPNVSVSDAEIIAHCQALLADFKVPTALITMTEMPLGATGKVDKNRLKAVLEKYT